jgi:site-specific DNA recombinase
VVFLKAVIYGRISGEEQSIYSLESQIEECKAFLVRHNHELIDIYIDEVSGKDLKRPRIQDLIDDLKKNKFDLVVTWKLDRLTRDTVDGLTLIINLFKKRHNVSYASVTEDIKTETPDDVMMLTIRLSMAQAEREKIRERTTNGLRKRAVTGKRTSSFRPYGYNIENMQLTVNLEESEIVRKIYQMYIDGFGRLKIADTLNEEGIASRDDKGWSDAVIGRLIGNVIHIGANHWKRKEDVESERIITLNMHEPIVPMELFNAAISIRERRKDGFMSKSSHEFCFSVIVKCGLCGQSFHGKTKTGTTNRNYRCYGNTRTVKCGSSDISEPKLTKLFLSYISRITMESVAPERALGGRDVEKDKKKLEKLLSDSELKKERYTKGMGAGAIPFDKFVALVADETDKQREWKAELDEINMQSPSHKKRHSDVARALENIKNNWSQMSVMEQKIILSRFFKYILIKKVDGVWEMAVSLNMDI